MFRGMEKMSEIIFLIIQTNSLEEKNWHKHRSNAELPHLVVCDVIYNVNRCIFTEFDILDY